MALYAAAVVVAAAATALMEPLDDVIVASNVVVAVVVAAVAVGILNVVLCLLELRLIPREHLVLLTVSFSPSIHLTFIIKRFIRFLNKTTSSLLFDTPRYSMSGPRFESHRRILKYHK